jgi:hypothetical protein
MGRPVPIQAPGAPLFLEELMATDEKIESTSEEKTVPSAFYIHNTIRSRHNRTQRAGAATHRGMKQYIGGTHRVIRSQPLAMSEDVFKKHLEEIKAKAKQGLIQVKTRDGRLVDLETLTPTTPVREGNPLPQPPLDSIQNDMPAGENRPQFAGGLPEMKTEEQEGAKPALFEGLDEDEPEEFHGGENTEHNEPPGEFPTEPHDHAQVRTGRKKSRR